MNNYDNWKAICAANKARLNTQRLVAEEAGHVYEDETIVNSAGGKQSKVHGDFTLIPPEVLRDVAVVLEHGAKKYGEGNWVFISEQEHINHAIAHMFKHLAKDKSEPHLINAICRLMFAAHMKDYNG